MHTSTAIPPDEPWTKPWPAGDMESVLHCPVCNETSRKLLHADMVDNAFRVAPGKWMLWKCAKCCSAYLDPRPTPDTIHRAYANYYTHNAATSHAEDYKNLSFLRRLRRIASNGYLNARYGTRRYPASIVGLWLAIMLPSVREKLDVEFRYLPIPLRGQRLLDIGCGSGNFLVSAREAGWQVSGVEPDPEAANVTRLLGVDVMVGTAELLDRESACFDAITISHVIEHVHSPRKLLADIYRLLKQNGVLYIETPNIDSQWAKLFKKNWRGLETPRHLVLFTQESLKDLILELGFRKIEYIYRRDPQEHMYLSSMNLASNRLLNSTNIINLKWIERIKIWKSKNSKNKPEFITLIIKK